MNNSRAVDRTMKEETLYFFGVAPNPSDIKYGLSNFTPLSVRIPHELNYFPWAIEDLIFPNAESAFQALKCHENEENVKKFMQLTDPRKAKALGRRVILRPDWEEVKVKWMFIVIYCKFEARKEMLLKTGAMKLVENNPRDKFWGCGSKKNGRNVLGKILMMVRSQLKNDEEINLEQFNPTQTLLKE